MAVHVFHVAGPAAVYHPTGSGDTTLDYIQVFCFIVVAAIGALVWSVLDRRRRHYRTLYAWLRLLVRFTLAFTLLDYGFAKIFPLQFGPPMLGRLTQSYGESSPMGLLWTFMGASAAYTKFTGLAEAGAGFLLLFRRTTVLGALASAAVMLNV
ncbi:MAG: DoxX family protein, partial [Acidobacteriota bacterium]|nr:DoxX family protein [Acidobacteriota bacterium]